MHRPRIGGSPFILRGSDTVTTCAVPDLSELRVAARNNSAVTEGENLVVIGMPLAGFGPAIDGPRSAMPDYFAQQQYFTISEDLARFEISGLINSIGWNTGNENNQVQLTVGCST